MKKQGLNVQDLMRPLDERRNHIVHWTSVTNMFIKEGEMMSIYSLDPPNFRRMLNTKKKQPGKSR